MAYYKGKAPCAGCNRTGFEKPRPNPDKLCNDCQSIFDFGSSIYKEQKDEYVRVNAQWYKLEFWNGDNGGKDLDKSLRELCKALDTKGLFGFGFLDLTEGSATTASSHWVIRKLYAEKIKGIVDALTVQQAIYRTGLQKLEEDRINVVKNERNKIFQQGVDQGKSLLIALNKGEISLNDFDQPQKLY